MPVILLSPLLRLVRLSAICLLLVGPSLPTVAEAGAIYPPRRVLVLYTHDRLLPANILLDEAFRKELDHDGAAKVEVFAEYLDTTRFPGAEQEKAMSDYLKTRYAAHPPQVLVAYGEDAFRLFQERRDTLFPGTPLVFLGTGKSAAERAKADGNMVGIAMTTSPGPTLDLMRRLQPGLREIVLIAGAAKFDRIWDGLVKQEQTRLAGQITITYWSGLPLTDVKAKAATLPTDTAILYLSYLRDPAGTTMTGPQSAAEIAAASRVPVFGLFETYLGSGVVGGCMASLADHGSLGARIVRWVLHGEELARIEVTPPLPRFVFDARELKRWGISRRSLPPQSVYLFDRPPFWKAYPVFTGAAAAGILLQTGVIVGLLVHRRRQRRMEDALFESETHLAQAARLALIGELTASIAHEINQPLGAILANAEAAEMLLKSGSSDELGQILADIRTDDLRASEVITRVRELVGKRKIHVMPLQLNTRVGEVLRLIANDARRRGVALTTDLAPDLPEIHGDRVQIEQVLFNLLLNGMEAMNETPETKRRLAVRTRRINEKAVEVSVSDRGSGIEPEQLPHIFDSFFTTKQNGMGLGLALARSIAELHHGRITAENNPEGGATFRVQLMVEDPRTG